MTIKDKIREYIEANPEEYVFLARDFRSFGSGSGVSRALAALVKEKYLYRISQGVYAASVYNEYGKCRTVCKPLASLAARAMDRLGIKWSLGKMAKQYAEGQIDQIPNKDIFEIGSQKISRNFSLEGKERVYFERYGVLDDGIRNNQNQ